MEDTVLPPEDTIKSKVSSSNDKDKVSLLSQNLAESITSFVHEVVNQPTVGLYFVQKHQQICVPKLVREQTDMLNLARTLQRDLLDVQDGLEVVRDVQAVDEHFENIVETLKSMKQKHRY